MNKIILDNILPTEFKQGDFFQDETGEIYIFCFVGPRFGFGFVSLKQGHYWTSFEKTIDEAISKKGNLKFIGRDLTITLSR